MRISEYYHLDKNQASLDFVDVHLDTDTPLFIDPTALHLLDSEWGNRCVSLIQDYFSLVLQYIKDGEHVKARALLSNLNEPNETRLGYSTDKPHGHGMGKKLAEKMWYQLKESQAVRTGLIKDLEDTALLIDGVASDVISDIVTNIIREPLLEYTADMCREYGIPLQSDIASGPLWDPATKKWNSRHVEQPVTPEGRLLLVPKAIVRHTITYQADNYYNMYLLAKIQEEEAGKGLVQILKSGKTKPLSKKSLRERFGSAGKEQNRRYTPDRPEVLEQYRSDKQSEPKEPLKHDQIADSVAAPAPDWDSLLHRLNDVPVGAAGAHDYEAVAKDILTALLYPWLMYPQTQTRIHEGRKRIDITYTNAAEDDFFAWLRNNYFAPYVIVECKNYSGDPENPELDQLSGRFGNRRGQFGLLVCRNIEDKALFMQRCKDTASDGRGYIIAIDDEDIKQLISAVRFGKPDERLNLLRERFRELT